MGFSKKNNQLYSKTNHPPVFFFVNIGPLRDETNVFSKQTSAVFCFDWSLLSLFRLTSARPCTWDTRSCKGPAKLAFQKNSSKEGYKTPRKIYPLIGAIRQVVPISKAMCKDELLHLWLSVGAHLHKLKGCSVGAA